MAQTLCPFKSHTKKVRSHSRHLHLLFLKNKYLCKLREEDSKNLLPKAQMSHMTQTKIKSTNSQMKFPSPEAAVLRGRCVKELIVLPAPQSPLVIRSSM